MIFNDNSVCPDIMRCLCIGLFRQKLWNGGNSTGAGGFGEHDEVSGLAIAEKY
jgi:hypothetical protein